jgi:glucose/arabinose dehydrogenase
MMKNLMSIALMAALSGAGMAALAQAPTPAPTQQTAPKQTAPQAAPKQTAPPATASAKEAQQSQLVALTAMDANRDGLVSRQEYMSHYEGLYGKIKKDSAGMISLKDFASTGSPVAAAQ